MIGALLGLLAQTEPVVETNIGSGDKNVITLIMNADIVVQLTVLLLVVFSVVSWAIIGSKQRQLNRAKKSSTRFYQLFWQAKSIEAIVAKATFRKSPAFNIFKAGIDTLREDQNLAAVPHIEKEIRRAAEEEIEQMEYGVPFLATCASSAPFIGLFGTVWGILFAFWKIGRTGSSSLAIIGPHLAEALVATAIGLIAAIPATIFYNHFVTRVRLISKDLLDFADDVNNRIRREYFNA